MDKSTTPTDRIAEVRQIFEDYGFGNIELLEGWEGDDLGELEDFLTEDEYQTLLDQLQSADEDQA